MIVCLDGPAGSGKSTISRMVAERAGFVYLDTGAFYRSLALFANDRGVDWDDEAGLAELAGELTLTFRKGDNRQTVSLNGNDVTDAIRTAEISLGASRVSRHPQVRAKLVDAQRRSAANSDIIAEGRDTGTVVFPQAELKIYLDASLEERARRRRGDQLNQGDGSSLETVMADLAARDKADSERDASPLKLAEDAVHIDTTTLSPDNVITRILTLIEERREY